jgi:hypothetical protein
MQIDAACTRNRPNTVDFLSYHMQTDAAKCKYLVDILVDALAADKASIGTVNATSTGVHRSVRPEFREGSSA